MNENPFPEIITNRLLLRRLKESDWAMISYLRTDKEVNKYLQRPEAKSKEEALQFITKIHLAIENQESYYWAITLAQNERLIGSISLWHFSSDKKTAEVGYDLSPGFQKKGIMDEALKGILDFGFNNLSLDIIEAYTHKHNEPSKILLIRNHFELVAGKNDDGNKNNIIYEIKKDCHL